jgi:hypothetical protein
MAQRKEFTGLLFWVSFAKPKDHIYVRLYWFYNELL